MYTTWKCSGPVAVSSGSGPPRPPRRTLQIPDSVRRSQGRWRLPSRLIRSEAEQAKLREAAAAEAAADAASLGAAQRKLARGFEALFRLLAPEGAAATVLTRRDLAGAADRWSLSVGRQRSADDRPRRLLAELWTLLDGLQQPTSQPGRAEDRPVSVTAVLEGLRLRARTRLDLLTVKRRLLRLAGDAFAVFVDAAGSTSAVLDGSTTEWTPRLLEALAAAGLDHVDVRSALTEAATPARASSEMVRPGQFGELRRDTWLRLVHAQFF